MARVLRHRTVFSQDKIAANGTFAPVGYSTAAATLTTHGIMAPEIGASVVKWGVGVYAAGSGNGTIRCTLLEGGDQDLAANRLADQLTFTLDSATAYSGKEANGPRTGGLGKTASAIGKICAVRVEQVTANDEHFTTDASFVPWVQWAL